MSHSYLKHLLLTLICTLSLCGCNSEEELHRYFFLNDYGTRFHYETISKVFGPQSGQDIAVGEGVLLFIFQYPMEKTEELLSKHFKMAEQYDIPIIVQFDPLDFLSGIPEILNWWDPSKPGYNEANRENVEWYGWGSEYATKIGWLNWGRQIRIPPMVNIYSPVYLKELDSRMGRLLSMTADWYKSLPKDKKYLLGGVKLISEFCFGVNNWYYENGNDLLDKPYEEDPQSGCDFNVMPTRGVAQTGYAALKYSGIRTEGEITAEDIWELERRFAKHVADLGQGYGFPRGMLFLHSAGSEGDLDSPIQDNVCPSWSFYHGAAVNPQDTKEVTEHLPKSDAPCWAISEWNPFGGPQEHWEKALRNCYSLPGCRFVTIYNLDSVIPGWRTDLKINEGAVNAIKELQQGTLFVQK